MYEKPVVIKNDSLAEGVYMDSGSDCWEVSYRSVQKWNGWAQEWEIQAKHKGSAQHISSQVSYVFTFSDIITNASSEFPCSFSGNQVIVDRGLLGDAYGSGDIVTFKVRASAGDQAKTEALAMISANWDCTHQTNVQGVYD